MQYIVADMREKFHNDRLRNDRALVLWISDNNKNNNNNNNVGSVASKTSILQEIEVNEYSGDAEC